MHGSAAEEQQFLRIAAIERQFHDPRCFYNLTHTDVSRLDYGGISLHFHLFGNLADLKRNIDRRVGIQLKNNPVCTYVRNPGRLTSNL